jgi:hypothetical protein
MNIADCSRWDRNSASWPCNFPPFIMARKQGIAIGEVVNECTLAEKVKDLIVLEESVKELEERLSWIKTSIKVACSSFTSS